MAVGFPAGDAATGRWVIARSRGFYSKYKRSVRAAGCHGILFRALEDPKELIWVEARDHFFAGGLDEFEEAVFQVGLRR